MDALTFGATMVLVLTVTATAGASKARYVRVVALGRGSGTRVHNIDISPMRKLNAGDGFSEVNVFVERATGKHIGRAEFYCTILDVDRGGNPRIIHCTGVAFLPHGQIIFSGQLGPHPTLAITGGGGGYARVRGDIRLRFVSEHRTNWDFRLLD